MKIVTGIVGAAVTPISPMLFRALICWLLACSTTWLSAEVRELWRTGLTNAVAPWAIYELRVAVVDRDGNTVVSGRFEAPGGIIGAFIAKFDSQGAKLWEISPGTRPTSGVEALTVDAEGNVIFTIRLGGSTPLQVTLIKVSRDGRELWRAVQNDVAEGPDWSSPGLSGIKTDLQGNVFLNAIVLQNLGPNTSAGRQLMVKFDAEGNKLWSTRLPGYGYVAGSPADLEKAFAITEGGEAIVVGALNLSLNPVNVPNLVGFAAKINPRGRVEWWTDGYKGDAQPSAYDSVLLNPKEMICAGLSFGGATTVFSANGKPLHTLSLGGDVVGTSDEGGFLLNYQSFLRALSPTGGNLRWGMEPFKVYPLWGIVPHNMGGWLAVGRSTKWPPGIGFSEIDEKGVEIWSTALADASLADSRRQMILQAPDRSLRVVAMNYSGVTVRCFLVGDFQ